MDRDKLISSVQQIKALAEECLEYLGSSAEPKQHSKKSPTRSRPTNPASIDFDLPERAFVKRYVRGMGGPKKFVLVLAYLTKGKTGKEVQLKEVEKRWNKMTAPNLLDGKFNRFYSNSAKEGGWVNTKKKGVYFLLPSWQNIFK